MNKLIQYAVMVAVGVLVFSALLIPVINDATDTDATIANDGYYKMQKITAEDTTEYTLNWDRVTDTFTLNGVVVDIGDHSRFTDELGVSVALTDASVSRYVTGLRVQSWIEGVSGSIGFSNTTVKINFNNGTETITVDEGLATEGVRTATYEYAYFISNTGDYSMKAKTTPAYVKGDTELFAVGATYLNNSTAPGTPILSVLKMTGNASEVEFSAIYGVVTQPTFNNVTIHKTDNTAYVGVYDLEKVTATATYDSATTDITYSYFIVPGEITAEKAIHADDSTRAIIGVIPLIVIVGLVAGIVGVIAVRRNA